MIHISSKEDLRETHDRIEEGFKSGIKNIKLTSSMDEELIKQTIEFKKMLKEYKCRINY